MVIGLFLYAHFPAAASSSHVTSVHLCDNLDHLACLWYMVVARKFNIAPKYTNACSPSFRWGFFLLPPQVNIKFNPNHHFEAIRALPALLVSLGKGPKIYVFWANLRRTSSLIYMTRKPVDQVKIHLFSACQSLSKFAPPTTMVHTRLNSTKRSDKGVLATQICVHCKGRWLGY